MLDGQQTILKTYMAEKKVVACEAVSPNTFEKEPIHARDTIIFQAFDKARARQWLIDNSKTDYRIVWESTPK